MDRLASKFSFEEMAKPHLETNASAYTLTSAYKHGVKLRSAAALQANVKSPTASHP